MSSLDADGKTSTCYRLSLSLLSERCNLQVVNLLSSCQVTTGKMSTCYLKIQSASCQVATGECCTQVVRLLSESAVCKLLLEDAILQVINLLLERCQPEAVNLLSEDAFCKLSVVTGMLYATGKDVVFRC